MVIFAFAYIFISTVFLLITVLFNLNIKYRLLLAFSFLFILSMSIIAYYFKPPETYDLYRYLELIDEMHSQSLMVCLFQAKYRYESFFNLFLVLTAKGILTKQGFVCITVFLIYWFTFKPTFSFSKKNNRTGVNLYLLVFLTFSLIVYAISGIRQQLATVLFGYAYMLEYSGKSKIKVFLLYLLAILTHNSIAIFFIIKIGSNLMLHLKMQHLNKLLIFWGAIPGIFILFLSRIPISWLNEYGRRLNAYVVSPIRDYDMRLYAVQIAFLLVAYVFIIHPSKKFCIDKTYVTFLNTMFYFLIGSLPLVVIFERSFRIFAVILLPAFCEVQRSSSKINDFILRYSIAFLSTGMIFYQIIMMLSHYTPYSWII